MSLRMLEPGLATRVVDFGRPHARSLGVPVGGAADRCSLALANALIGNPPDAAGLEMTLVGPLLRAETDVACAVYGAPFTLSDGRRVGTTFALRAGETLRVGGTPVGMRAYLCVRGGFRGEAILGSRSGLADVVAETVLPCAAGTMRVRYLEHVRPVFPEPATLRVLPGLQVDWFTPAEFYDQAYVVRPASNRMGLRLGGRPLTLPARELASEPVAPGAVQITRDGQPIVLGADGQTIGGYPKIAHVIRADLDRLGQLRPGGRVRFVPVSAAEATAAHRAAAARLRAWVVRLAVSLDG